MLANNEKGNAMYFTDCHTIEELKRAWHKLALKHHPDRGGDTATMQRINADYQRRFDQLKADQNFKADHFDADHYKRVDEDAKEFINALQPIIGLDGLEIELCGSWVWVGGETYKHKSVLKGAGYRWSRNKQRWYWRSEKMRGGWSRGGYTMEEIRARHGSKAIVGRAGAIVAA